MAKIEKVGDKEFALKPEKPENFGEIETETELLATAYLLGEKNPVKMENLLEKLGKEYHTSTATRLKEALVNKNIAEETTVPNNKRGPDPKALEIKYRWITEMLVESGKIETGPYERQVTEAVETLYSCSVIKRRILHPEYSLLSFEESDLSLKQLLKDYDVGWKDARAYYTLILINYPLLVGMTRFYQENFSFDLSENDYLMSQLAYMHREEDNEMVKDFFENKLDIKFLVNDKALPQEDLEMGEKKLEQANDKSLQAIDEAIKELMPFYAAARIRESFRNMETVYEAERHDTIEMPLRQNFSKALQNVLMNRTEIGKKVSQRKDILSDKHKEAKEFNDER